MQTLSKGWKLPETGDFGDVWFPALEDNINQLNTHDHDGVDSEKIIVTNLTKVSATVLGASFVDQGNGYFRALVTMPGGLSYDNFIVTVKDPTTKEIIYLKQEKVSSTTYYLYTNTQQDFEAFYSV